MHPVVSFQHDVYGRVEDGECGGTRQDGVSVGISRAYRLHCCTACSGAALQEGVQVGAECSECPPAEQTEGTTPAGDGRCSPCLAGPFAAADCTFRPADDFLFQRFGHLLCRQFRESAGERLFCLFRDCFLFHVRFAIRAASFFLIRKSFTLMFPSVWPVTAASS